MEGMSDSKSSRRPCDSFNLLVLGPTGAGKSSLIYTWWRALQAQEITAEDHNDVLAELSVGWSVVEPRDNSATNIPTRKLLRAHHGTKGLRVFELLSARPDGAGICVHDTKGQQFYDTRESKHASSLIRGVAMEGSNQEHENLRYWLKLGNLGLFQKRTLADTPHVVVLVFDVTLRSLQKMISAGGQRSTASSPHLMVYNDVVRQARLEGLEVFVALTHMDALEAAQSDEARGRETRVGETVSTIIADLKVGLSNALQSQVPPENINLIESYRVVKHSEDPRVELAALELLEALVTSSESFIAARTPDPICRVS